MALVKGNKKIRLSILLGLVGLILLVVLAINPFLKSLLATRVQEKLVGNFYYHYDDLTVNLLNRSVKLENVTWRFPKDTTIFKHSGHIRRFEISGVSLLSLIRGDHFKIQEIRFDSLTLVTRIEKQIKSKRDSTAEILSENGSFSFYDLIKGQMKSLEIEKIEIIDGKATWLNPDTKIVWRKIDEVQFNIKHIQLDSAISANNNGWFTLDNATLEGKRGELFLPDSLHKFHFKKFQIDYLKQRIIIDSLNLIPLITKAQMHDAKRYETNRMEISIPKVTVTGIDMGVLMIKNKLRITHILIDHLNLDVFRDKTKPIPHDLYIGLPQEALKNAMLNIKIDSVHLANSFIRYEEVSEITQKRGVVFFSEINADIINITNDSLSNQQNSMAMVNISAMFLGKGKLDTYCTFNLLSEHGDHSLKGSLGQFELTELNSMLEPLKAVSVRSGHMDKLAFDIRLNNDVSDGQVNFLYADFKIDKIDDDDLKGKELDNIIKSFLANTFVLQGSNPSGKDEPRIGTVHFEREKDKAIFHFWLQSILEGVKSTVLNSG